MKDYKGSIFLTSDAYSVAHDIGAKVNSAESHSLVFIDTAAEAIEDDKEWLRKDREALTGSGFEVTDYTITGKKQEQIKEDLKDFDVIYLSGGSAAHLLKQSRKSGFFDLIKEFLQDGKIYMGTSAGSIVAGPRLPDYLGGKKFQLEDRACYNFVNFTVIPHWGSDDFKDEYLGKRINIAYREDQVPLLMLTNNQYVHVHGDEMKIVDVKK